MAAGALIDPSPSATLNANGSTSSSIVDQRSFGLFPYLNDDMKMLILSYVADAPLESMPENYPHSSLTHKLPHVCKKFHSLSGSDQYWKHALERQTAREPRLWKHALHRMLLQSREPQQQHQQQEQAMAMGSVTCMHHDAHHSSNTTIARHHNRHRHQHHHGSKDVDPTSESIPDLIARTHVHLGKPSFKSMYQEIVSYHLRYKGPIFIMPGQVQLGEPYALHLFEPRYCMMITELMRHQPDSARQGGRIDPDLGGCFFVHANRTPLAPTMPATLVQIVQCHFHPDGSADVMLLPIHYVWIESVWIRPHSARLFEAQCLKMGERVTHQMNHLARQEALALVMDRLVADQRNETVDHQHNHDDDDDSDSDNSDHEYLMLPRQDGQMNVARAGVARLIPHNEHSSSGSDDDDDDSSDYDSDFSTSDFDTDDYDSDELELDDANMEDSA